MNEYICIVCPNGCTLRCEARDGALFVTGNKCKRGEAFAIAEHTAPMRTVCSTVRTDSCALPRLPVRTSAEIPKARVFEVMRALNGVCVHAPIRRGDCVIKNVLGLAVDIIATADMPQ